MNCRNCGAALVLAETRTYSYCPHCGTFHFPDRDDESVRVLGGPSDEHACPECRTFLSPATLDDHGHVFHCGNCRGVLLPRRVFASVIQTRRAWASSPPAPPVPLDQRELEHVANCPACRQRMATHPYHGPGAIVIDTCDRCDVIWLGTGELQRAVGAPGRDRGSALRGGEGTRELTLPPPTSASAGGTLTSAGKADVLTFLRDVLFDR